MTIYTGSGCTGTFVGSGIMFAPGQPSGAVVNYWPSQSRYDRLTSDLINNRWNKIRINVDTGSAATTPSRPSPSTRTDRRRTGLDQPEAGPARAADS